MAPQTPVGAPASAVAGDSWRWKVAELTEYPQSEGWSLKYQLVGDSILTITPTYQTSGDDIYSWLTEVSVTDTAKLTAGLYRLIGRMVGSGDYSGREETVHDSVFQVLRDPRTAAASDFQSHAERTLEVIEAAIEGRMTKDMESYSIAGRAITKIPIRELVSLRATYSAILRQERTGQFAVPVEAHFG